MINYFLRVKHDGFIEFFQIFFFFFLFNNCENCELSALRDRCYTSPFNVDYPRWKKGYLSINFKKRLRKPKTANANEHAIPASSSSSSIRSILHHSSTSKRETVFRWIYVYIYGMLHKTLLLVVVRAIQQIILIGRVRGSLVKKRHSYRCKRGSDYKPVAVARYINLVREPWSSLSLSLFPGRQKLLLHSFSPSLNSRWYARITRSSCTLPGCCTRLLL